MLRIYVSHASHQKIDDAKYVMSGGSTTASGDDFKITYLTLGFDL